MYTKPTSWAHVDEQGRLIIPPDIASRYGMTPGSRMRLDPGEHDLRLHRPVTHLAKVYVEPTNRCNLTCRTCIRNVWDAQLGHMSKDTFERILEDLTELPSTPTVFFGGLGEPLSHPYTIDMVARTKTLGGTVEMITNGTFLTEEKSKGLIEAGLDVLWVSIDGARPESYADVRLGAELPTVIENLNQFRRMRPYGFQPKPEIGIVFVAMKRNIADLPEVLAMGRRMRASRFLVSNLLPYTRQLNDETLYNRSLHDTTYLPSSWVRHLHLPKMDFNALTQGPFLEALRSGYNVTFAGNNLGGANDVCTFIERGSLAIGWDGSLSPCPPLLYNHTSYLHNKEHISHKHIIGNINERKLLELWNDPDYITYRDRVQSFSFAPCTFCGGCDLSEENNSDCFNNPAPACGGCLWAQCVIQCP